MFRLVLAGVAMVAVTFGFARYAYGLVVSDIRSEYGLNSQLLGLLATASTLAYLVATVAASALAARLGPRAPVVLGGALAVAGMTTVGVSSAPATLAVA